MSNSMHKIPELLAYGTLENIFLCIWYSYCNLVEYTHDNKIYIKNASPTNRILRELF